MSPKDPKALVPTCPRVLHETTGRLRLRVPYLKGNELHAQELRERLAQLDGVTEIIPSTMTGNLVVRYDARLLDVNRVLRHLYPDVKVSMLKPEVSGPARPTKTLVRAMTSIASRRLAIPELGLLSLMVDLLMEK